MARRELCVGDIIRWTRSDRLQNRIGGQLFKVESINDHQALLVSYEQKKMTIDLREKSNQHWDHAYAVTTYFAQGQTHPKIIALLESYKGKSRSLDSKFDRTYGYSGLIAKNFFHQK